MCRWILAPTLVLLCGLATAMVASASPNARVMDPAAGTRPAVGEQAVLAGRWNLVACDLTVTYRLNMRRYAPRPGTTDWISVGVSNGDDARGWLSAGAPFAAEANPRSLDLDDKWNLGAPGRLDEWSYNVLGSTIVAAPIGNPAVNYGIWFDRTGVDAYQALLWGMISGITYSTGGDYQAEITFHAMNASVGTMQAKVNGLQTGFYAGSWRNAPPDYRPVGKSFTGDVTDLRVFRSVMPAGVRMDAPRVTGCRS